MCIELAKFMMHKRIDVSHDDVVQRLNKARSKGLSSHASQKPRIRDHCFVPQTPLAQEI